MTAPAEVSEDLFPVQKYYYIQTRIVIEGQILVIENEDGEKLEGVWWARQFENIKKDLANAEELFKPVGLKFNIVEVSFKQYSGEVVDHFVNAIKHSNVLTITYMLPKNFVLDGLSTAPWEVANTGIVIGYFANEHTLAHELGHYFGLLHTFSNDYIDDTPEQSEIHCAELNSTPNCRNIMSYCLHTPKFLTGGQISRMTKFLRASRRNNIAKESFNFLSLPEVPPGLNVEIDLIFDN